MGRDNWVPTVAGQSVRRAEKANLIHISLFDMFDISKPTGVPSCKTRWKRFLSFYLNRELAGVDPVTFRWWYQSRRIVSNTTRSSRSGSRTVVQYSLYIPGVGWWRRECGRSDFPASALCSLVFIKVSLPYRYGSRSTSTTTTSHPISSQLSNLNNKPVLLAS